MITYYDEAPEEFTPEQYNAIAKMPMPYSEQIVARVSTGGGEEWMMDFLRLLEPNEEEPND